MRLLIVKLIHALFQIRKVFCIMDLELQTKIKAVKDYYEGAINAHDEGNTEDLTAEQELLFSSAQRWHENSHMTDREWISLFNQIKSKMNIERFDLKDSPKEVVELLEAKFSKSGLTNSFYVSDIFSEDFISIVKAFFIEKTEERDNEDEFDDQNICSGWKTDDIPFYSRTFMPFAVFFTYKQKHQQTEDKEIVKDCFTLGAGSKCEDLTPEVNVYCHKCCFDDEETWKGKNLILFKKQWKNKFDLPVYKDCSDSDVDIEVNKDLMKSNGNERNTVFNPYVTDSDENSDEDVESSNTENVENISVETITIPKSHKCQDCPKEFSKEKFLLLHHRIFHAKRSKKVVVPKFTDEPVDLMETFIHEDSQKAKKGKVNSKEPKKVVVLNPRRSLRFDKS